MTPCRASYRRASAAALAIGLASLLAQPAPAQAPERQRTLFVSALDKASRAPVESLAPSDLTVKEDGATREVLRVSRVTEPMQLAILVDNSTAANQHISNLRDGLKKFADTVGDQHAISLITYSDRPTLVTSFSTDRAELRKAIERIFAQNSSGAYLLDAIQETSQGFIKRESPRPVIVVVGMDGVEFSNQSYEPVLERLQEAGAQLHVLTIVDREPDTTQEQRYRSIVVDRGTRETGGRREDLLSSMALPEALASLAAELNAQFKVVYARPDSLIPPRETTVASARPNLEIRGVLSKAKT